MEKESKQVLFEENAKRVEVVKYQGKSRNNYIFECSDCGEDIKAEKRYLRYHSGKCRGCARRLRPYEWILNKLYYECKNFRNFDINITYEDFLAIINDPFCHYCDRQLAFSKCSRDSTGGKTSRAYQLDRKDNSLGYVKGNLVPCCWDCNRMKSNVYAYEEFIKFKPILREVHREKYKI